MLQTVLMDIGSVSQAVLIGVSIDASNEVFFAQQLARKLSSHCRFHLIKGNENLTFQGQTLPAKEMLGNLYVNAHIDGILATPEGGFIKEDRRLVQKSKGRFVTLVGKGGKHGDTFDSGKHARWVLLSSGPIEAAGVSVSGSGQAKSDPFNDDDDDDGLGFGAVLKLGC
jgi:hypothetical protein